MPKLPCLVLYLVPRQMLVLRASLSRAWGPASGARCCGGTCQMKRAASSRPSCVTKRAGALGLGKVLAMKLACVPKSRGKGADPSLVPLCFAVRGPDFGNNQSSSGGSKTVFSDAAVRGSDPLKAALHRIAKAEGSAWLSIGGSIRLSQR
eukprot:8902699-Pyramimonas_sp.AAC.1